MNKYSIETVICYFERIADSDYAKFMRRDGVIGKKIIGVRMAEIHRYAKKLIRDLPLDKELVYNFIKSLCTSDIRELQQLGASILKQMKTKFLDDKLSDLVDEIVPYIENWEFCDTLASAVSVEISLDKMTKYARGNEWAARFGLVCAIFANKKGLPLKSAIKILDEVIERNPQPSSQLKKAIKWAKREFNIK